MRIRLKKRKQKELIAKAKEKLTWKELARILGLSSGYLRADLTTEKRLLSEESYKRLCKINKTNFDEHIIEKLADNWGKAKGGENSKGNTKIITPPKESKELAELCGIILGDGHLEAPQKDNKNRSYALKIAGHLEEDENYLSDYVSGMIQRLFNEKPSIKRAEKYTTLFLVLHGKKIIEFFNSKGLKSGNKKYNNQGIPAWIKNDKNYLLSCVKGLIDTDGSIHRMSKQNKNIRINYTSYIPRLLTDFREAIIALGFNPSKIIRERQIFLSRKEEVARYFDEIGSANEKHLKRLEKFKD